MCTGRGEVPIGRATLDETIDLAFKAVSEQTTAARVPQAGIFLDSGQCYARIRLHKLEQFDLVLESGYPFYALYAALNMYGQTPYSDTRCCEPTGDRHSRHASGHAVDLLHAFLIKTLKSAQCHVHVRKYVDGMVLVAKQLRGWTSKGTSAMVTGKCTSASQLPKTAVVCNGANAKRKLAWRCPVECTHVVMLRQAMKTVRALGLPAHSKARIYGQVPLQR
eukprot:788377-Amphidinium_carterae.1